MHSAICDTYLVSIVSPYYLLSIGYVFSVYVHTGNVTLKCIHRSIVNWSGGYYVSILIYVTLIWCNGIP